MPVCTCVGGKTRKKMENRKLKRESKIRNKEKENKE
jgi:hypothetical protein